MFTVKDANGNEIGKMPRISGEKMRELVDQGYRVYDSEGVHLTEGFFDS